ncbi:hypothetical protein B0H66DRAFT_574740 [Apodospora peruviana]|uniref:Uncharacterized protein n=1 Tax=Apodospora peruviana TaxID=516989 RepID=A0AAE0ICU1_9PEZI|nr:hypothetical protein B0H66DRAFT_574740 [Apodospora peruviana]
MTNRNSSTEPFLRPGRPEPLQAINRLSACAVDFLFPTGQNLEFHHLDSLNVTYRSSLANPTLSCWCGEPGQQATEQFRVNNASPFHGSVVVLLNFSPTAPCWFELESDDTGACRDQSTKFALSPKQPALSTTTPATTATDAVASETPQGGGESLNLGARVALAIGITLACLAVGAMAAFLYFRRRKKHQEASLAGAIIDHDRRHGRKGPEKPLSRNFSTSVASERSDQPLYPIQPVFDGYPGSMGYDDVRSLDSGSHGHSPVAPAHSPTFSQNTQFWGGSEPRSEQRFYTGRDELTAARLNSNSASVVTSYGPNPVTPTLTPRASSRADLNVRAGTISIDSREEIPPMPGIMPEYINYSIPPPSSNPRIEISTPQPPSPPRKPAPPIVVSYGPNRVTPTPAVHSPTVPLDDAIVKRRVIQSNTVARPFPQPISRENSWEAEDELLMAASTQGPLPPYASTEDFYAMEKGAIRRIAEPQAQAELPPTKDGYYHDMTDIVEYELQGASLEHEPQLPYDPYRSRFPENGAGPSNANGNVGGNGSSASGWREIDEQKFLLDDAEIREMKERAKRLAREKKEKAGESYDLGEGSVRSGSSR